jgi:hypothetical protein
LNQETNEPAEAVEESLPPDELFSGTFSISEALAKLRLRLLDLTARNRLLNFKPSAGKSLQFVEGRLETCYQKLVESPDRRIQLHSIPTPRNSEFVEKLGRRVRPEVRDYAKLLGFPTSVDLSEVPRTEKELIGLRALFYPDDFERQCRKLSTAARTAIEETGANMLFLLLGFLEYPEAPGAGKTLVAPLVPVPVTLEKGDLERSSGTYRYSLVYTGEELTENLSLREKLKQDFNVALPDFTEESTLESYYGELTEAIEGKEGFKLRKQATLALVSMTKMLLVRDLDPRNWPQQGVRSALADHEIVRMVFEGGGYDDADGPDDDNEEYIVDAHTHANLPLIYDADSSQHSALIDAIEGKNLVIEGPPGTGKSQTITNLIASAISTGKKVLFVAEKVAALQVVRSRLAQAGLADFCLELHSNKMSKKDVLDSIEARIAGKYARPPQLASMLEALKEKRRTLTEYVELINTKAGNAQGMSIHQVLWRAERFRQKTGDAWRKAQTLTAQRADELTKAEFDSLYDELTRLVGEHERIGSFSPVAPFWGFFASSLPPAGEVEIERALTDAVPKVEALKVAYGNFHSLLDRADLQFTKEEVKELAVSLAGLSTAVTVGMAEEMLPRLFADPYQRGSEAETTLRRLEMLQRRCRELAPMFLGKVRQGLSLTPQLAKEAGQVLAILKNLGIDGLTSRDLEALGNRCKDLAEEGRAALEEFKALADVAGAEFRGTDQCLAKVAIPIELSTICPRQHLHRRSPELSAAGSASIVLEAKARFENLGKRSAELSKSLYMDVAVAEREVEEVVQVLREGDEWWRIFQSRHRAAIRFHKRLSRNKRVDRQTRRKEMEALHAYLRDLKSAKEDLRFRKTMGPHWQAEATDFDVLHVMASWIEASHRRLVDAGLDETVFSPMEVTATRIASLSRSGERLKRAQQGLEVCTRHLLEGELRGASAVNRSFANAKTWNDRLQLLDSLGQRIVQHAGLVATCGPENLPAQTVLQALIPLENFQTLEAEIDRDEGAKDLLQDRFEGLNTSLPPVFDALTYGRAVLELHFPPALDSVLLSASGNALREQLIAQLRKIDEAWIPVDEFCDFLGARGRFELEQWAGCAVSAPGFIDGFLRRLQAARSGIDGLLLWVHYIHAAEFARSRGVEAYVDLLEEGEVDRKVVPDLFGYRFYGTIVEALFKKYPLLGKFSALSHEAIRSEFRNLDEQSIRLRGQEVAATAADLASPPLGTTGPRVSDKTERILLRHLFPQARPRVPIRKMMIQAGRAIQEYKPCFMMGPQAVAQYLPPDCLKFDIVVMDEASQLKPEEALGAIARGNQLIVVGDPKQLPPTTFFDKLGETQDEEDSKQQAAVMQPSILEVCMGHFRPVRTLRWHYRSQHHSLIAFSNTRFYRNKLVVFPSPYERSRNLGCKMHYIAGATYDNQMNLREAEVVADAVLAHMRDRPTDSLGVVTLNLKQRDFIEEVIAKRARNLELYDEFCARHQKDGFGFFVKNLENVQGDERDVIFISTTFGPAPGTNAVAQRFGPISQRDGWRRLNVLFTRARKSLTLFTSMRPEDIVDGPSVPKGRRELRAYLDYLRSGVVPQTGDSMGQPDSDFEVSVIEALEHQGYECTPQLGVAGYRIDVAVKHPMYAGTYLAAIECDGAAYHSGRSARDRDRIRQEILERLGWKGRIHRIWSTDWYRSPGNEMARLLTWLAELKTKPMEEAYIVREAAVAYAALGPGPSQPTSVDVADAAIREIAGSMESDEPLEVQVGDKVTFVNLAQEGEQTVTIGTHTDNSKGLIDYRSPLAEALLGLNEGEIGPLAIAGRGTARLRVVKIERIVEAAAA